MTQSRSSHCWSLRIAVLIGSLMMVACSESSDPQALMVKAKQYLEQKNPGSAVIELKNALQKNPDLGEARFLLGKVYLEQGQATAAEIELRKALGLQFDAGQTVPLIASSMLSQGKGSNLIAEFERQKLQSTSAQAELLSVVGMAHLGTGKLEQAQNNFSEAQKINPGLAAAVLGEARVKAAKGEFSASETLANSVLEKSPKYLPALMFKGDLHRAQNQFDKAITSYEQVIADHPKNINARLNLANTYLAAGKVDAGRNQIEELKKLAPKHPGVTYFEALIAFNEKKYEKADEAIQRTLAVNPENTQVLLLAGTLELLLNRPAQSEQHLRKALAQAPGNLFALKSLTRLYIQQRDLLKGEQTLQSAIKIAPNDPELLSLAGDTALTRGEFHQASTFLNQAAQFSPKNSHVLTQSAIAQFAQGNNEYAIAQLESASKLDANNARPDLLLVLAHMQRKEYDKALESWASLQKRQPDNPLIYNLQAAILLTKNDVSSARKALEHTLQLQPTNFPAASNLANLDIQDMKLDAAKQRFRSILEKDKNNLSALLALAGLEQSTGAAKQDVLKLLNQARQGNPEVTQPVLALVKFHLDSGDPKHALAAVQEALVTAPKNQQLQDTAGQVQLRAGETAQAVETYARLVADNPDQANFLLRLGQAQVIAGKIEAAKLSMSKALQLKPDSADVQVTSVNAFLLVGKPDDALKMVGQIRKFSPKSPNLDHLEGDVWIAKRDYSAAMASYKKALAVGSTNGLLIKTHQAMLRAGNKDEAGAILGGWLKSHPDDVGVQIYSAENDMRAGDYKKAKAQFGNILSRQPNNVLILNNMAWVSLQTKDPKAIDYAQKAYAIAPQNPAIADTLGWILVEQGQLKRGIELLENTSNRFPKQLIVQLHLAKALIKDGRKDAAREQLQALVKAESNSALGKESAQLLTGL